MIAGDTWEARVHLIEPAHLPLAFSQLAPGRGGPVGRTQSEAQLRPLKEFSRARSPTPSSISATLCFAGCGLARNLGAREVQAQAESETRGAAISLCSPPSWPKGNALLSLLDHFFENLEGSYRRLIRGYSSDQVGDDEMGKPIFSPPPFF